VRARNILPRFDHFLHRLCESSRGSARDGGSVGITTSAECLAVEVAGQSRYNGANGISDIEYVRSGIVRVDGNAARVAGASTEQCD
jgi:hypothetical protein